MKDYLCNGIEDCDGSELDSNSTNSDNSGLSSRFLDDIGSSLSNFWDKVSNFKDEMGLLNSYDFGDFEGYIHELDADTGMITGLTKTNLKSISQVAVFSDKLFAQDIDGSIVGFNLK